jgi:processive 1,2-diacylglycerol beta-glucosyltransferase
MKRILVLHVSVGTGHTSAAKALGAALEQYKGVEVHVEDVFDHVNDLARRSISEGYNEVSTRLQPLYTMLHSGINIEDTTSALSANRVMTTLGRPFLMRFEHHVAQLAPDAIVSTMQIPFHILHSYANRKNIPEYAVITDFSVQSTWLREGVAGYFVASELTRDILLLRGISPEHVHVTGIPVKLEIAEPKAPAEMRRHHGLPLDQPLISIFGGGLAIDRVRFLVEELIACRIEGTVAVVAGRNRDLVEALDGLSDGPHMKLRVLGYIDYVDDLVAASDLVVSKPGGLITSEVLARATPMIVVEPIPGQEEWNADVVAGIGAGVQLRVTELVPRAVEVLLRNPQRLAAMREAAGRIGRPQAAFAIAEQLLADLGVRA